MPRVLTQQQAARELGCGIKKVRQLCDIGELERIRTGYRTVGVIEKSIESYIRRKQFESRRTYRQTG